MQTNYSGRIYSPQLSETANIAVKRLSWALDLPMTKVLEFMVRIMPSFVQSSKVCLACKDKSKCHRCTFSNSISPQEQEKYLMPFAELII